MLFRSLVRGEKNYYRGLTRTIPVKEIQKINGRKTKISWKKIKHANSYDVLVRRKKGNKYKKIASTRKTHYTFKNSNKKKECLIRVKF